MVDLAATAAQSPNSFFASRKSTNYVFIILIVNIVYFSKCSNKMMNEIRDLRKIRFSYLPHFQIDQTAQ